MEDLLGMLIRNGGMELSTTFGEFGGYAPKKKEWITTAIGTGLGVASSTIGFIQSYKAADEAQRRIEEQHARDNAWYNLRYNENYADTAAGQAMRTQVENYANDNWKKAQGASAMGGSTESATAQAKEAGNRMIASTMSNMAAQDTARKSGVDAQHRQDEKSYTAQMSNIAQTRANNISKVAGGVSNALMQAGLAFEGNSSASTQSNVKQAVNGGSDFLGDLNLA